MRTINKSKSKQGVVLVTIIFILAIAMIFIASALLLTKATRGRLYERAEDNQARLTVTSAAESFYQALYLQEITDDTLATMDGAILNITGNMPGMMASGYKTSTMGDIIPVDNATIAVFKVTTSGASSTDTDEDEDASTDADDKTLGFVQIDFMTNINNQIECIAMGLQIESPHKNQPPFPNVVEIGNGGSINNLSVGGSAGSDSRYTEVDPKVNTVAVHGQQATTSKGRTKVFSTYITTGHTGIRDTEFYGDVVFWGPDAGFETSRSYSDGTPLGMMTAGSGVYFINNTSAAYYEGNALNASTFVDGSSRLDWTSGNAGWVFSNKDTDYTTGVYIHSSQVLNGIGEIYTTGSINLTTPNVNQNVSDLNSRNKGQPTGTYATKLTKYADSNYSAGGDNPNQFTWSYINSHWGGKETFNEIEAKATTLSGALHDKASIDGAEVNVYNLGKGAYILDGSTDLTNTSVVCDLNKGDFFFFVQGDFTFTQDATIIAKNGVKNSHAVYVIIDEGCSIKFAGGDSLNGFISTNVFNTNCDTFKKNDMKNTYTNKGNINQGNSPYIYIYSKGGSSSKQGDPDTCTGGQIEFCQDNRGGVMTAYVGLYSSKYDSNTNSFVDDAGAITYASGSFPNVYGRLSASYIRALDGSNQRIPYCPVPNTDGLSDTPKVMITDYRIMNYQYYTVDA